MANASAAADIIEAGTVALTPHSVEHCSADAFSRAKFIHLIRRILCHWMTLTFPAIARGFSFAPLATANASIT
jgi:hypothetical protein